MRLAGGYSEAALGFLLNGADLGGGRAVEGAMSGRSLDGRSSLPCPPGLDVPPEVFSPFTSNNLKVSVHGGLQALMSNP